MCKDSRIPSGGGCEGGGKNGGCGGRVGFYPQKVKRQKVPKRGPGVAELEKLLKEQQQEIGTRNGKEFSLVRFLSNSHQSPNSVNNHPLFNSSCKSLPFGPNQCDSGKSGGLVWPDQALVHKMWIACEANCAVDESGRSAYRLPLPTCSTNGSKINTTLMFPSLNGLKETSQCYPQSSIKAPGGLNDIGLVPPSSQTAQCHGSNSIWPQDHEMGETNMPFPFLNDIPPVPLFSHEVQAFSPLECGNQTRNLLNPEPTETASRNSRTGCSAEPSTRSCSINHGTSDDKFFPLGSSTVSPWNMMPPCVGKPKINHLYLQEYMEQKQQSRGPDRPNYANPFLSFLTMDHIGTTERMDHIGMVEKCCRLSNEKVEANVDGIDLDLRL